MPRRNSLTRTEQSHIEMLDALKKMQDDLTETWVERSLPDGWDGLDASDPVTRPKTRVTVRLDEDMVRWFRKLGPGYGKRMNAVLRIYWLGLVSGNVRSHWNERETAPRFAAYISKRIEMLEAGREDGRDDGPDERA